MCAIRRARLKHGSEASERPASRASQRRHGPSPLCRWNEHRASMQRRSSVIDSLSIFGKCVELQVQSQHPVSDIHVTTWIATNATKMPKHCCGRSPRMTPRRITTATTPTTSTRPVSHFKIHYEISSTRDGHRGSRSCYPPFSSCSLSVIATPHHQVPAHQTLPRSTGQSTHTSSTPPKSTIYAIRL